MQKYFFKVTNGSYYFWDAEAKKFMEYDKSTLNNVYLDTVPKEVKNWFHCEATERFKIICKTDKPTLSDNAINKFQGFLHAKKAYKSFSKGVRENVDLILSFILEVLANNEKDVYEYFLNWYSNVCKGKKNDSVLYLRGVEGIGKSTITDFMREHVLGSKICSNSVKNARALTSPYNGILSGKLLVVFEELPNSGAK